MDDIKNKLGMVGTLVSGWEATGRIDELERDLVLESLRDVYSAIKSAPSGDVVTAPAECDDARLPVAGTLQAASAAVCHRPDPDTEAASEAQSEPESVAATQPESVAATRQEPFAAPPRVAPDVIRSLYGTDEDCGEPAVARPDDGAEYEADSRPSGATAAQTPEPACEPEPTPEPEPTCEPEPEPEPTSEPEPEPEPVAVTRAPNQQPSSSPLSEAKPVTTLGDVIAPHRTLAETLRGGGEMDVASKIAAAGRSELKRSIGLNDRFLMIRDMFDGDAAEFDRAITRLDAFTDLDEAVIWIHDNYDWSADSKGASLLVGLLERKLGR